MTGLNSLCATRLAEILLSLEAPKLPKSDPKTTCVNRKPPINFRET